MIIEYPNGVSLISDAGHIVGLKDALHIVDYHEPFRKTLTAIPPIDGATCDCGQPATWWEENRSGEGPRMFFFCPKCASYLGAMKKLSYVLGLGR